MVGNYKLLIRHNELRQFDKHLKMSKSVQAALLFGLVVAVLCHGPPDPLDSLWDTASAVMYNQLKLATEVDTANNTKQLLLELKSPAAQTVENFGCKFDPASADFTKRFLKGFGRTAAHIDTR